MVKSNDSLIKKVRLFSKGLPNSYILLLILFLLSIIAGMISVALTNYANLGRAAGGVIVEGLLSGILLILIPTLLSVLMIKGVKRIVRLRHLLFMNLVGAGTYAVFIIISSAMFLVTKNYSLANAIVLVGDAGVFAWWFFISKVVLGQKKKAVVFSLIQPFFNILFYLAASSYIFTFSVPLSLLIIKLFAGFLVFLVISYVVLYIFDNPLKRNLGFGGIDFLSEMVQNWLFDIDLTVKGPLGGPEFGVATDIQTQTLVFKNKDNKTKAIFFAPWIHYGPVGTLGGSNFPYLLERHGMWRYKAPTFVLHCAVNESSNPVSSSQFAVVKTTFESSVRAAKQLSGDYSYCESAYNGAKISQLCFGNVNFTTFTRAPKVTEDIAPDAARLFKELLEGGNRESIMIDAHNSRFESAPADELDGVKLGSSYANDYIAAIKKIGKPSHKGKVLKLGIASVDAYDTLGAPSDLAPGNLNVAVFSLNGFKKAIVYLNANNMMPSFREKMIEHIEKRHKMHAEIYTTDTHFVNSLQKTASNVLGREASYAKLERLLDKAVSWAMSNMEPVDVYYKKESMKNFKVWGPEVKEKALAVIGAVTGLARILVPVIVVAGFIIAALIISFIG